MKTRQVGVKSRKNIGIIEVDCLTDESHNEPILAEVTQVPVSEAPASTPTTANLTEQ
jgi:hypothetical protein